MPREIAEPSEYGNPSDRRTDGQSVSKAPKKPQGARGIAGRAFAWPDLGGHTEARENLTLQLESEFELGKRSYAGSLTQIALLALLYYATDQFTDHPWDVAPWAMVIVATSITRIAIALRQESFYPRRRKAWNRLFNLCVALSGLAWGAIFYHVFHVHGPYGYSATVCMLIGAGISAGITTSVSPRRTLALIFIAFVLGTPFVDLVARWTRHTIPLAMIFITYFVFLWVQLRIQHVDYWRGLVSRHRLADERNRLRQFLDTIPGLALWVGEDMKIHGVNKHYATYCGGNLENILGSPIGRRCSDPVFLEAVSAFILSRQGSAGVELPLRIDGTTRWHLLVMNKAPKGGEAYLICIDIHELHEARSSLEQQRAVAERSSKLASLGELATSIAHEIKNPLTAIGLTSQILQKGIAKGALTIPEEEVLVERIFAVAQRIEKIVSGLTRFSRTTDAEPFARAKLAQIVTESVALVAPQLEMSGIALELDPIPEELEVRCRPVEISQVLVNLLNNAMDAIRERSSPALDDVRWIRLSVRVESGVAALSIADSGPGIPSDARAHLFEPFFTTKPAGSGTGLGLSISRRILARHSGSLEFDHTRANTTFVMKIPLAREENLSEPGQSVA